jgi:chromate transporter
MIAADLLALFGHFLVLSLLSIGGALTVVPEMHRVMVGRLGLLTDEQFNASIAIGQAAPGPNVLFVAAMGYQAAGFIGAAVTLFGILLPSATLAYAAARWGHARRQWRALRAFRIGMAPLVIALVLAAGFGLGAQVSGWPALAAVAVAALLAWRTRVHVLVLVSVGAAAGAMNLI